MRNTNVVSISTPEDLLQEFLRRGAKELLQKAIEREVGDLLAHYKNQRTDANKQAVVRNGYLPERSIQTGLGDVDVNVPKVRDRSGQGIKFTSKLVPPYLKRTKNIEEFYRGFICAACRPAIFQNRLSIYSVSRLLDCRHRRSAGSKPIGSGITTSGGCVI